MQDITIYLIRIKWRIFYYGKGHDTEICVVVISCIPSGTFSIGCSVDWLAKDVPVLGIALRTGYWRLGKSWQRALITPCKVGTELPEPLGLSATVPVIVPVYIVPTLTKKIKKYRKKR